MIGADVWPDQMDVIVGNAHARGLMTMAEPGFTSYAYAVRAGVGSLLSKSLCGTAALDSAESCHVLR